ncbi:MAG: peptidylprolyl isomerase, partial [Sedimentitalea sp.]
DDVDLGDVERSDLDATTADAVFDAAAGDIIGPLPSDLGPALFRINGVLDARVTPFEDVADELRDELAGDSARRQIEVQAQNFDDLLAGGATLEELAEESDMQLNTLDWTPDAAEDAAAYVGFNRTASTVTLEDFPSISYLDDGGIFALRLDDVLPPRPEPFDDARSAVTDGWVVAQTEAALGEKAAALLPELATSGDFAAAGLAAQIEEGLVRTAFIEGTPPNFLVDVFEMSKGDLKIITGGEAVMIVRLDDELPPEATSELGDLRRAISQQVDQSLANALFQAFVNDAQSRANPRIDQQALNAVQAGMGQPGHGGM